MLNSNWRLKIGKRRNSNELDWHIELHQEFVQFAEEAELLSRLYDWDFWGGGVGNYAVTLSQSIMKGISISIRMFGSGNCYYVSFANEMNPNNVKFSTYNECIAKTMDDALKYLHSFLIEHRYTRNFNSDRICVMGGAYERYLLALRWAYEELEERKEKEKISV